MKKLVALIFILSLFSCKKTIEEIQTNAVIQAMTSGQWKMVNFKIGTTDHTSEFAPYAFQFHANYTVDAIKNSAVEASGNWNASAENKTITSNFSPSATNPLPYLNGTWKITNNSWTYVEANQEVNGTTRFLRLEKL